MQKKRTVHRYQLEGITVDIPAYYDEARGIYIEEYPQFQEHPVYTMAGNLLTLACEDVCPLVEPAEEESCIWCQECRHFTRAGEDAYFGICHHEKRRKQPLEAGIPDQYFF